MSGGNILNLEQAGEMAIYGGVWSSDYVSL